VQIADNLRYRLKSRYSGIKNSPEIFLKNGFEIKRGSCFPDGITQDGVYRGVRNFGKKIPGNFFLEKVHIDI
jgi:hypothetical protein